MSDPLPTVEASLYIQVEVTCPHCAAGIDLLKSEDTDDHPHDSEGAILSQACPNGVWVDHHRCFSCKDVTCTECKKSFNVENIH